MPPIPPDQTSPYGSSGKTDAQRRRQAEQYRARRERADDSRDSHDRDRDDDKGDDDLIPDAVVARQHYGVHPITIKRWDDASAAGKMDPPFPQRIEINGRFYRRRGSLTEFNRLSAVARAGSR